MTREQAIRVVADWWYKAARGDKWDNGDSVTEAAHIMFKSMFPAPSETEWQKVRDILSIAVDEVFAKAEQQCRDWQVKHGSHYCRTEIYADYGCRFLDEVYKRAGIKASSSFFGPQKAGTFITASQDGDWTVEAKNGYGAPRCKLTAAEGGAP